MTFHLKTYPDALRQLFVSCSVEDVNTAFNDAVSLLQKKFTLPGYRKGKVPTDMIVKSNPPELMNIVSEILMKNAYTYIDTQKTPLYSQPRFNPMSNLSQDKEFVFSLVYEIYPTIVKEPELSKLELIYDACELDQKFIEAAICRQIQLLENTEGVAEEFDLVKVEILNNDYTGDKKEALFDTSRLELLIGKKTGETISINFDELSGYLPEFIGKVSDPLQIKIIELSRAKTWGKVSDDEIKAKTAFNTKDEFYEQSKQQFEHMVTQYNNTKKIESLTNKIGSLITAELPKSLWLNNLRDLTMKFAEKEVLKEELSLENISTNNNILEKFKRLPIDSIEGLSFIIWLEKIAEQQKITIEENELEYHYYRYAQAKHIPMKDLKKHITPEEQTSIKNDAIREKAITYLLETVRFKVGNNIAFIEVLKTYSRY